MPPSPETPVATMIPSAVSIRWDQDFSDTEVSPPTCTHENHSCLIVVVTLKLWHENPMRLEPAHALTFRSRNVDAETPSLHISCADSGPCTYVSLSTFLRFLHPDRG
ncbi:unnamed protein product [Rangifer tarandus platyrhynchus]|uniref:Uncharacterized protein n=1 Tax=Rangifer tarandus platyrhynchus TaxID=3082113 RepID=A0AC59YG52_RANTA